MTAVPPLFEIRTPTFCRGEGRRQLSTLSGTSHRPLLDWLLQKHPDTPKKRAKQWILAGRVSVNGRTAQLGSSADPERDLIRVDGARLAVPSEPVYVVLHKPAGVLSSARRQDGRPTVIELIDVPERVFPVGRLDLDSEGLLLLTNDGELAQRLTHPRYGHEREYRVLLDRVPEASQLDAWRRGIVLPDGARALPAELKIERQTDQGTWVRIIMREGRKRQIRETARLLGLRVRRLIRVRMDGIVLGTMKPGEWRRLTPGEASKLRRATGLPGPQAAGVRGTHRRRGMEA